MYRSIELFPDLTFIITVVVFHQAIRKKSVKAAACFVWFYLCSGNAEEVINGIVFIMSVWETVDGAI